MPQSWIRRLNVSKKLILPKLIKIFNTILIQIPTLSLFIFPKIDRLILKISMEIDPRKAKNIMEKKNKV